MVRKINVPLSTIFCFILCIFINIFVSGKKGQEKNDFFLYSILSIWSTKLMLKIESGNERTDGQRYGRTDRRTSGRVENAQTQF